MEIEWSDVPFLRRQGLAIGAVALASAAAFVVLGLPPEKVAIAIALAGGIVGALLNPTTAISLLAFSFFVGMSAAPVTLAQGFGALAMCAGLLVALVRREKFSFGNLMPWFSAWAFWIGCSYLYASSSATVSIELRKFVINLAIYSLIVHYFRSVVQVHRLTIVLFAAIALNAVSALWQWWLHGSEPYFRATGLGLDPNYLGALCVAGVGIAVAEHSRQKGRGGKVSWLLATVLCLAGMLTTASRTAHVAIILMGFLIFVTLPERRRMIVGAAVVLFVLFPYAPTTYRERMQNLGEEISRSLPAAGVQELNIRGYLAKAGLRIWRDHPIIGAGIGHFRHLFLTVGYNPGHEWDAGFNPHNAYVGLLAETGIIGLFLFSAILGIGCWNYLQAYRQLRGRGGLERTTAVAAMALMLVHMVMTLTIPILTTHSLYLLLALSVVMKGVGSAKARGTDPVP